MTEVSHQVNKDLWLVEVPVGKTAVAKPAVQPPVHHIVIVDASGSMAYELASIRLQLKNKLPKMVAPHDLVSIGWFSGDGQADMLVTAEALADLTDFQAVNKAIDRLHDVGMTGFMDPILMIERVCGEVRKSHPNHVASAILMTDGGHNGRATRAQLLAAAEKASGGLASFAWVAFGHYADLPFLTQLGEKSGGSVVLAEDFRRWEPVLEAALKRRAAGGKKLSVPVPSVVEVLGGIAWSVKDDEILAFGIENHAFVVPPDTTSIWYLSPSKVGAVARGTLTEVAKAESKAVNPLHKSLAAAYAGVTLFGLRMKPKLVKPLLRALGDVALVEEHAVAFGRQRVASFVDHAKLAALSPSGRFHKGYDPSKVPAPDAFTVLDLIDALQSDEGNRVMLDDARFVYNAIGRGTVDAGEVVTPTEERELEKLREDARGRSVVALKALATREAEILARKRDRLVFVKDPPADGYPVSGITTNETRPNIGINVTIPGHVDLTARLAGMAPHGEVKTLVPASFPTKIIRTRSIIADGLLNVDALPVRLTSATWEVLAKHGVLPPMYFPETVVIQLATLPIINEQMTLDVTPDVIFTAEWDLTTARCAAKVHNAYKARLAPKGLGFMGVKYPADVALWLKEQGLTDGGFNPKRTDAESKDVRRIKEVDVSLKGFDSATKIKPEDVLGFMQTNAAVVAGTAAKGAKVKTLTPSQMLFVPAIEECEAALAKMSAADFVTWIDAKVAASKAKVRHLLRKMAQIKFSISVGGCWPFESLDETTATMQLGGHAVVCTLNLVEKDIPV